MKGLPDFLAKTNNFLRTCNRTHVLRKQKRIPLSESKAGKVGFSRAKQVGTNTATVHNPRSGWKTMIRNNSGRRRAFNVTGVLGRVD